MRSCDANCVLSPALGRGFALGPDKVLVARTLKLTIAYDGTDFAGWQRQATDRTVQASIEDAIVPIEGGRVAITGAGRTDAGVHAAGQVASVTLQSEIAIEDLQRALNATLPADVRIMRVDEASLDFNARFDARQKTYHYWIWASGVVPPQLRRYVWHVPQTLDVDAMSAAAAALIGEHDFAAFQGAGSDVKTSLREVIVSRVRPDGGRHSSAATGGAEAPPYSPGVATTGEAIRYEITGTGFLRHMVRNIVGTIVDVGRGRRAAADMRAILESRDRARASGTAPPRGLVLWTVDY